VASAAGFILCPPKAFWVFSVSFLDEDELDPAASGAGSRRAPSERQRQVFVRRVVALGVGVLILILLLLGVRGCLDARKERGFENYASDLGGIVTQSNLLSQEFFGRLEDPDRNLTELQLEAEITTDRGTAESLLQRVEGLDVPDEVAGAQEELVQAFELRRDGIAGIADDIPTALGDEDRNDAIARIAADMQAFLASDVLFDRARAEIEGVLAEEEIGERIPPSRFLPEPVERWLDSGEVTLTLNTFAAETGNVPRGIHGVELVSTSIDRTTLIADTENSIGIGNDPPEIDVEIQNGGDTIERDVTVTYSFSGGPEPIEGEATVPRIDAEGIAEATLPLETTPETDVPLTLVVEVLPVLGETLIDNNALTYTVTFN
jgi:hypothetical protein